MTHEELTDRIKDKFNFHTGKHDAEIVNALYKVVELHSPLLVKDYVDDDAWYECQVCMEFDENVKYPCPTIQAIEKELQ